MKRVSYMIPSVGENRGIVDAILVDMHAEATSEKQAMGHFLDGRVSAVVGSHTHVPTADARILPKGTAYQTDCGMCGDYNSIIGFEPTGPMQNFLQKYRKVRMEPASGNGTLIARDAQQPHRHELWLDHAHTGLGDLETRLSRLTAWVLQADRLGLDYGLRLPGKEIAMGHGAAQRRRCLEALALC